MMLSQVQPMRDNAYPDALPGGHRLHWYVLERVLGQGGFGITYLARDSNLDRPVAIKEYLPAEVAQRHFDATVRPRTESLGERYAWGLERFIVEARTLARFDHPNIVRVHSVFEANGTAYMVMRFEEGQNLASLLEDGGTLPEAELLGILMPILDGLGQVHEAGFIHRDIKPENIHMRSDGTPVLLDFGSARQSLGHSRTVTILVAPGYAPLEQYYGDVGAQGPWTDIYGLAATCYRAITGRTPADAIVRTKGVLGSTREVLEPASTVAKGRYSAGLLAAIDHGLELGERERPQSLAEWRREIGGDDSVVVPFPLPRAQPPSPPSPDPEIMPQGSSKEAESKMESARARGRSARSRMYRAQAFWAFGGAAAAAMAIGLFLGTQGRGGGAKNPAPTAAVEVVPPTSNQPDTQPLRPDPVTPGPSDDNASMTVPPIAEEPVPPPRSPGTAKPTSPVAQSKPASKIPSNASSGDAATHSHASPPEPIARIEPPSQASEHTPVPEDRLKIAQQAIDRGDYAGARRAIEPLAQSGQAQAQELLGRLYEDGHGVPRSANAAYMWYSLAARQGDEAARTYKARVASRLQKVEIERADRQVEGWLPQAEKGGPEPR